MGGWIEQPPLQRGSVATAEWADTQAAASSWIQDGVTWESGGNPYWAPWMEAQALAALWAWMHPGGRLEADEAELTELRRLTQHLIDLGRPVGDRYWQVPKYISGYPIWTVRKPQDWGHPVLNGWFHLVWSMAAELGITHAAGVPLAEAAERSRETAFGRLGRGWRNMEPQAGDLLELMGGVRMALGSADEKLQEGALSGVVR